MIDKAEYWDMIQAMQTYGGGFVNSLAECMVHADNTNFQKLLDTFPEYVKQYQEMAGNSVELHDNSQG